MTNESYENNVILKHCSNCTPVLDVNRPDVVNDLRNRLHQAYKWFSEYAKLHEKKGKTEKMKVNRDRARYCLTGKL
jgi:hypothetical protein